MDRNGRKIKRLFFDIETAPNVVLAFAAGFDKVITHDSIIKERYVLCIGYKWEGEKSRTVLRCSPSGDDRDLLARFIDVAVTADELVAHFGDRFDLPWVRTRALILKLNPLPFFKTIDTKAWASKNFYFNSNKLDYISQVLGHGRKLHTDFSLWKDIMIGTPAQKKKAMDYMCKYCGIDVVRLEQVYLDLAKNVKPKTHAGVIAGNDRWTCPRCGSKNVRKSKTIVSAAGTVTHQMRCFDDGSYYQISDRVFRDYQEYKQNKK
jgi:uncharacterized protein YprB with RNaseH-like and TPR domain